LNVIGSDVFSCRSFDVAARCERLLKVPSLPWQPVAAASAGRSSKSRIPGRGDAGQPWFSAEQPRGGESRLTIDRFGSDNKGG
jgi:hypothetical protein